MPNEEYFYIILSFLEHNISAVFGISTFEDEKFDYHPGRIENEMVSNIESWKVYNFLCTLLLQRFPGILIY